MVHSLRIRRDEVAPPDRSTPRLRSDGNNDTAHTVVQNVDFPVHVLAISGPGLQLTDYLDLSALAPACAGLASRARRVRAAIGAR